jgi:hypothetical protein
VKRQWYRWSGGEWVESGGPASLPEGKNVLEVKVEDNAWTGAQQIGNVAVVNLGEYWLDTKPPVTTVQLSPSTPDGANGWYTKSPTVTLVAVDPNGANGSGVVRTEYSIDGGAAVRYTGPFVVGPGSHEVRYWSTDGAGNVEAAKSLTVAVIGAAVKITSGPNATVLGDSVTIEWETDVSSSSVVEYGLSTDYGRFSRANQGQATE